MLLLFFKYTTFKKIILNVYMYRISNIIKLILVPSSKIISFYNFCYNFKLILKLFYLL